ncbi:TetR/AcrR family transcriptional regulator [Gordonia sp. zg691]|uniref:TetR/AcrR family transcriptional regulator n=1 Tax=Gordonia jinghuaiqii TaxID=2758710 RepID=UPI0016622799|nr:TetR/AcrR family transcriptional regulator [Gordonia jinghuaiqii]MBD0859620.1 TetR/AcrR family transcriptional regulator [Gordonia jinghuaiqii]
MAADSGERIVRSTLELLRTRGPASVTIEAVAAHSGVARTTIYRRYKNRDEMLTAALRDVGTPTAPAGDLSGEDRLRWVVRQAAAMVVDGIGFGGMAALITDADPAFTELFRKVLVEHRARLSAVLTEGAESGTLAAGVDPETLIDAIVGVLVAERARTGAVADDWEGRVVAMFAPIALVTRS